MSLRQRIIPSAELPFPALASIARQQVLSRKLQTDSHAIRKRYNARVGNRGRHEVCLDESLREDATYNPKKPDTDAFRSVSR